MTVNTTTSDSGNEGGHKVGSSSTGEYICQCGIFQSLGEVSQELHSSVEKSANI